MARSHARIATSIWADADFARLRETEQRAYLLALSQPGVSYAGVVSFTLRRWEGLASDSTTTRLRKAFLALQERLYVLIDEQTEEMLLRTFLRYDGIMGNPNVAKASVAAYKSIHSPVIRGAWLAELRRMNVEPKQDEKWAKGWAAGLQDLLTDPLPYGFPNPLLDPFPEWLEYARAAPAPTPSPVLTTTCEHGCESPSRCALCRSALRSVSA